MRSKRRKVLVLDVVRKLKAMDRDSAHADLVALTHQDQRMREQLSQAQSLTNRRTQGLQALLEAAKTFDPTLYRSASASIQGAQAAARRIADSVDDLNAELLQAHEQVVLATAGHQVITKAYRKTWGQWVVAQQHAQEREREDTFTAKLRRDQDVARSNL